MSLEAHHVDGLDQYLDSDLEAGLEQKYTHQSIGLFPGVVSFQDQVLENSLLLFLYMAKYTSHFWGFDQGGYEKAYHQTKTTLPRMNGTTLPLSELAKLGFLQVRQFGDKAVYFPSDQLLKEATRLGSFDADA